MAKTGPRRDSQPLQLLRPLTVRPHLIPLLGPLTRLLKINMRLWIPQFLELCFAQAVVGRKDGFAFNAFELGDPFADVVALGVALFGLRDGIEDGVAGFPAVGVVCEVLETGAGLVSGRPRC